MKKQIQEYLTYYSPEFIYIPYTTKETITIRKDRKILNNMFIGTTDNKNIYSPVSGLIVGTKKMNYLNGESDTIVIENDFLDKRDKLNPFIDISKIKKTYVNEILNKYNLNQKITSKSTLVVESTYDKKFDLGDMVINYESYEEILEAIDELLTLYNIKVCYIILSKNDVYSEVAFNKYINAFPNICIVNSSRKYKNDKCVFYSIEDILAVYRSIHQDYLLDNTMITINFGEPIIVRVKIYTSLSELLKALKITYRDKKVYVNDKLINDVSSFVIDRNIKTIKIV